MTVFSSSYVFDGISKGVVAVFRDSCFFVQWTKCRRFGSYAYLARHFLPMYHAAISFVE